MIESHEEIHPLNRILKNILFLVTLVAICSAQTSQTMPSPRPGYQFPNNQTYVYDVEWRLFAAGTASLHMEQANGEERVVGMADSIGAIALLYHVHDRFESFVDHKSYCSLTLGKQTEEGFRRLNTNIRFIPPEHKSVLEEKNLRTNQSKRQENAIPGCVSDVLSSIYYVGSLPLAPNATYTFPINDGGKTNVVDVHVEGKEEVKVPAATYQTIRVQPETHNSPIKNKGQIWLWYSDDNLHIPVQMRARMFWGTLTLRLNHIDTK